MPIVARLCLCLMFMFNPWWNYNFLYLRVPCFFHSVSSVSHVLSIMLIGCGCWMWCIQKKEFLIIRLDASAKALSVIATATWLAGWLGGWLAVTLRYCIKTAKPIGKLFRPSESPINLVF